MRAEPVDVAITHGRTTRSTQFERQISLTNSQETAAMIKWAIIFFLISLVAGFFGFSGVAADSRTIAKILFFIALAIFLIVLVFGVLLGVLVF
jgi:uncharacterized membrane protein YtjA (UPF0391 family)